MVLRTTLLGTCPGGFCNIIKDFSEVLVLILCVDGFLFLITLVPPIFNWQTKKPDGRKRIWFAALACITFYFWLAFLALNSVYCFGFLAHEGPCKVNKITGHPVQNPVISTPLTTSADFHGVRSIVSTPKPSSAPFIYDSLWSSSANPNDLSNNPLTIDPPLPAQSALPTNGEADFDYSNGTDDYTSGEIKSQGVPQPAALITWTASNSTKSCSSPAGEHESELKNLTLANILILVVLFIVLFANAKEAFYAKAMYHKELQCKKEEVQKFLSSIIAKPPEVGHLVNCFHIAKSVLDPTNKKPHPLSSVDNKEGAQRKIITFSAIENFEYQNWRDFSDVRLIDPSVNYPVIEVEISLNFFPGDHFTAEKYKEFVLHLTKQHQGKDAKISIDDYFHVEDHREWTFFIGNPNFIEPWWDKFPVKFILSCVFLIGWPFRLSYVGRVGKHVLEIKKAVFVEYSSQDEGVSLTATPGSNNIHSSNTAKETQEVDNGSLKDSLDGNDEFERIVVKSKPSATNSETKITNDSKSNSKNEHIVDAVISHPPRDPMTVDEPSWQGQQYVIEQHHHHQQRKLPQQHNTQQDRVVQELQQHHIVHQQQPHSNQQQGRYVFQIQENCQNSQLMGPSLPTTLGSVAAGFGRNSVGFPSLPLTPPMPPQRSKPLTSPRTHMRETTKEIMTAVAHSDLNGLSSAVNTVALKDIDVQLSSLSGYETYV